MRWLVLLLLAFTGSLGLAQPKIGIHPGYTRMVFDFPKGAKYYWDTEGNTLWLKLWGVELPAQEKTLGSAQVVSYRVVPQSSLTMVYVQLKKGVEPKDWLLTEPRRLVLDLLGKGAGKTTPRPKVVRTVVIDPGHGGIDPGMQGIVSEKFVTLDISLRLAKALRDQGIRVVMTRDYDKHLSSDKGTDLGRRADMATSRRNLFISVHVNATKSKTAQGIETFYFGQSISPELLEKVIRENGGGELGRLLTRKAQGVANDLLSDLVAQANQRFSREFAYTIQRSLISATSAVDRGIHAAPWYVIRNARIPAILVEVGFGDHKVEGKRLADPNYRQTIANALAKGVVKFLSNGQ
jgi:N-acetylmuramoyl-L-alanine amidase